MKLKIEIADLRKEVTKHFKIKVYSKNDKGKSINSLRGYSGLIELLSFELAEKLMINALNSESDKIKIELRRGLTVTFYSK